MAKRKNPDVPVKIGRPEKPININKLKELCGLFCTGKECAALLEVSYEHLDNWLHKNGYGGFVAFFQTHSSTARMSIRRAQYLKAIEGNVPMQIWLGKQYLGQLDSPIPDDGEDSKDGDTVTFEVAEAKGDIKVTVGKAK